MILEILITIATLIALLYYYITSTWNYWKSQGVYTIKPSFPFGSFKSMTTRKIAIHDELMNLTKETKGLPYFGGYLMRAKIFVIQDPEIVRQVLIKDFDNFVDRRSGRMMEQFRQSDKLADQIFAQQLTTVTGDEWKKLRTTFSPIFTSGKMKAMMVFMQESTKKLMGALQPMAESKADIETKDIMGKFSTDVLASCAFGVDGNLFGEPESPFVTNAKAIFTADKWAALRGMMLVIPFGIRILNGLGYSVTAKETEFFCDVVTSALKHRKATQTRRNDLIDMLADAMKGELKEEPNEVLDQFDQDTKLKEVIQKKDYDEFSIVSTVIVLLISGYDTTGSLLAWVLYELAKNQSVQDRLYEEIESHSEGNEVTYEEMQSMTYLDQILSETLRLHSPLALLSRASREEYKIPGTDVVLPKGTNVWVNTIGIHTDPKHYETPRIFNPDHFSKESKGKRSPYAFVAFGQGPRNCIGMRLALLEAKIALATIVKQYRILPSAKNTEPLILDPKQSIKYPKSGLYVKLEPRI